MISALFPGQGSQQTGMGKFLFENFSTAKQTFEEASDIINIDLKKLCFDGPDEELQLTQNTQPAILTVSIATARVLAEISNIKFDHTAGHSVGEYASFVLSNSLSFSDAVLAVRKRGEFMQEAVPVGKGGMIAVMGLSPEQTEFMCEWAKKESGLSPISAANYNAPGQIVCSGAQNLVEWLKTNVKKEIFKDPPKKLRLIPLKVSAPLHCSMMAPAEEKMSLILNDMQFSDAEIPIMQNFTAKSTTDATELKINLIKQITGAVKWQQSIDNLCNQSVKTGVELGTGNVIAGLVKKINPEVKIYSTNSLEDLKLLESL